MGNSFDNEKIAYNLTNYKKVMYFAFILTQVISKPVYCQSYVNVLVIMFTVRFMELFLDLNAAKPLRHDAKGFANVT